MAAIFKIAAMKRLPVFFPFLHWPLSSTEKTTHILVFLNIHLGILTWNMGYFVCICTIFACWPEIVNFMSPNYAQWSVFVQIKFIASLAVWLPWAYFLCFFYFLFFIDLFLARFCKVYIHSALCPSALVYSFSSVPNFYLVTSFAPQRLRRNNSSLFYVYIV